MIDQAASQLIQRNGDLGDLAAPEHDHGAIETDVRAAVELVHALSEEARRFYLSRGFIPSPIQPMTWCLMLATVEQALQER